MKRPILRWINNDEENYVYNEEKGCNRYLHVLERGSRGPSTVTLIAFVYVATCGGLDDMVIVTEKLFPVKSSK